MAAGFYVYEHRRADSGEVFYVGKGSGARVRCKQGRNPFWMRVAEKHGYETRVVVATDDEELAFLAEMELIDKHRRTGIRLTNMTDGGEGMSGHKFSEESIAARAASQRGQKRPGVSEKLRGRAKSEDHRRRLSEAKSGSVASQATKDAMSRTRKGRPSPMKGKKHSKETKAKISAALSGENGPFFGKTHSKEAMALIMAANVGRKDTDETRAKKSAARLGKKNPRYGAVISDDQKARQIASLKLRPRVACPHCGKVMDESNAKRWHFDNCRSRP